MAGYSKIYTSQTDYLYDIAKSQLYFSEEQYAKQIQQANGDNYLAFVATYDDNLPSDFKRSEFDRLGDDDKFAYMVWKTNKDVSSESYKQTKEYFTQKFKEIKNREIYDSLNGFEKTMATIGGFVGNAVLQVGGIVEGLIDAGALLIGQKDFVAKDFTGYGAAQEAMNDWINKYTFIDKNAVLQITNDVVTGIARMTPMIVGGALAPFTGGASAAIGTTIYYLSMAGNTAEQTIRANPDINYGNLLLYTGASVGLEALTEWASGKIFGDDVISSLMKGQKYVPTGSIIKTIAKNFGTEALEEATAELFGSLLYKAIVDQNADVATFGDIMYAALIGGLTGALMSGGQVLSTKRMSVKDGKLVETKSLTKEERKSAKNLGIRGSFGLNGLLNQAITQQSELSNVTKLMTKYGTSLSDIQTNHKAEYDKAVKADEQMQTQQAKVILELANVMRTIGVEQFKRSAKFLDDSINDARLLVDNYLNHTDALNKEASVAYSSAFEGQSFTPTATTNAEQALAKTLREMFPGLKVAFGKFGSEDGLAVRSVNGTTGWLFIESGSVEAQGYQQMLQQTIRNEIAKTFSGELSKLPAELTNPLVKLLTDKDVKFADLSEQEKHTIAQMICFDPVANRKTFLRSKKAHSKLFKHITDQAKFVKQFARKTEANKVRYRDLLEIRRTFINSIIDSVGNNEDVEVIANEWGLTEEETKELINKTIGNILTENTQVSNIDFSEDAINRRNAIQELQDNRLDITAKFDYTRAYDENYYNPEWVAKIKEQQQTNDFEQALKTHMDVAYKTTLEDRDAFVTAIKNNLTEQQIKDVANVVLTKEFIENNQNIESLQDAVADTLYTMSSDETEQTSDSVVVEDGKLKGTGKLGGFINIQLFAKKPTDTSKTAKRHITTKDISILASKDYKTGEIRKSKAKGYENVEYEAASVMDYEQHAYDTLKKIKTLDDLKTVLSAIESGKIGDLEASFILNLLDAVILPTNFKDARRYVAAKALLDPVLSARTTSDAQKMAARSELFGETNPVKSLSSELTEKLGTEVKPSDTVLAKWVEGYSFDRTDWLGRLQNQYNELFDKRKHEKDPYLRQQYTLELHDLRLMIKAVAEGDSATILDLTVKKLQNSETDTVANEEKQQQLYKDIVADIISRVDTSKQKAQYNPNKKYVLKPEHAEKVANLFEKINSFRYLAMLSSPTTWGRNALTNTLITANAIVEDAISGKIEKSQFLRNESQAQYTGDYDDSFSNFVEDKYKARIAKDTKGDKYHVKEIDALRQEWAAENDPLKKNKILYAIKEIEQKALNDQPWTTRRVMRNLKGMLAGSMNLISKSVYSEIKALYKGESAAEIHAHMVEKGSPLADLFEQVYIKNKGSDMEGTITLAEKLSNSKFVLDEIYNRALYRGNKLLFKTENVLNKKINKLKESHPAVAGMITLFVPFARTSWNTTAYIINHSPVGLIKGAIKALQTRHMYYGDMKQAIMNYHKTEYIKQNKESNSDFKFDKKEFDAWATANLSSEVVSAMNGDYKAIKNVFDQYVELGRVNQSLIGSSDMFARADTIESISQGLTGTALLGLGFIMAALCDGFKIDEDDYLGPVLSIDGWRIKLDDLSPFSTMFSVGAIVNSEGSVLDKFKAFADVVVDASMLNIIESAIQYSDGVVDYLGNQSISIVQQFIPAIAKNFTKVIDNSKKDKTGNYFERLWKTTFSNTPLLSYLVADKIDPYTGEKEKIYQSGLLEAIFNQISPIGVRNQTMSDLEREARRVDAETTGLSGKFTVNDVDYNVKNEKEYAKYRAEYIDSQFSLILSGKQKVTVEDENGKRITTTYDKLNDKQKKNVINRLYTDATAVTKIKWWTDQGNKYVVTNRDQYNEYRKMFDNIIYKKTWTKSKFVES